MRENGGLDDRLPLLSDVAQTQVRGGGEASGQGVLNTQHYLSIKINFLRLVFFLSLIFFRPTQGRGWGLILT